MTHYYKLAFTTFRVVGIILIIFSLLSCGYGLLVPRPTSIGAAIVTLLPAIFYLLLGILLFTLKKQLASLATKGLDDD